MNDNKQEAESFHNQKPIKDNLQPDNDPTNKNNTGQINSGLAETQQAESHGVTEALPVRQPISKKLMIIILGIILVFLTFGLGVYLYRDKLNNDVALQREAATHIDNLTVAFDSVADNLYPDSENSIISGNYWAYYYEGLTSFNSEMEIQPQLALSWENPDTNTWRFRLRKDVSFHNGQHMTADDVVASVNMAINNDYVNVLIPTVQSIKKVDDYTVDIKTDSPTPILANLIPQIYILPKTLIASRDWENPIGTGPYKVVSYKDSTFNCTRFDNYYGQKVKVKDVTLKVILDDDERLAALKSGQIDVSLEASFTPEGTKTNDGKLIRFAVSKPISSIFLAYDSTRDQSPYITGAPTNPLKDLRVRQAMSLAIDTQELIDGGDFNRYSEQATQIVPSTIFGYNPDIKPVKQDIDEALDLMKKAGFKNGFTITIDSARRLNYQKILQKQLAKININLIVKYNDPSQIDFYDKLLSGDVSMVSLAWTAPSGDALEAYENELGMSEGTMNIFKINDAQINRLIEQARTASDLSKRKEYLQELASIVDQKKYFIPLLSQGTIYDYREGLLVTPRADGMYLAAETSGIVPDDLNDYTYMDTVKKLLHLKS